MYYYRSFFPDESVCYEQMDRLIENEYMVRITKEEYEKAIAEIEEERERQEAEEMKDIVTYEQLQKENAELLYQVLTGEELDVTTN